MSVTALRGRGVLLVNLLMGLSSLLVTALFGAAVLWIVGAAPLDAYQLLVAGSVGTPDNVAHVLTAWAPVLLCSAGLLLTFTAGLWNIGIEGQVVLGAVFATGALRALGGAVPPWLALLLAAVAAMIGGGLWGAMVGVLKAYGNVNEIFGGLGLNFIAGSLTVYLVLGPWARPGIASTSGTVPFPSELWLATLPVAGLRLPVEMFFGLLALLAVYLSLKGTYFGLHLKAIGKSFRAAFLRGVPNTRQMLLAFSICGALAGLAGFVLVTGTYSRHQLFPLISGGYGFLSILVVMLANYNALWSLVISFFFSAIAMGSLQLTLRLQLDSSIGTVLESMLVLAILLLQGIRSKLMLSRR